MKTQERLIKLYFYVDRGNALVNSFHSLGLVVIGLAIALHPSGIWQLVEWTGAMGVVSLPLMALAGWYNVNHMAARQDYWSGRHGSYYTRNGYELQKQIRDLLKSIDKKMSN